MAGKRTNGVCHARRVGHDVALSIVEAQNDQLGEVEPIIGEELEPIIDCSIDRHNEVELSA